jgi:hypothetical protein
MHSQLVIVQEHRPVKPRLWHTLSIKIRTSPALMNKIVGIKSDEALRKLVTISGSCQREQTRIRLCFRLAIDLGLLERIEPGTICQLGVIGMLGMC